MKKSALMPMEDRCYSQYGEQAIILDYCMNQPIPRYCVDAGAFDGVVGSNSRALFISGWAGLAIEPNPRTFKRLRNLYADRRDVRCCQVALSDRRRFFGMTMQVSVGPDGTSEDDKWQFGQVSTFHGYFAEEYKRDHSYRYEQVRVPVTTLNHALSQAKAPREIGFLSIDCEGEDLRVLHGLDLSRFSPRLICVESDDNSRHSFSEYLSQHGYKYHAHTTANTFYTRS